MMLDLGVELELGVLLVLQLIGTQLFARFEIETPAWRKILKWAIVAVLTLVAYRLVGHWALALPVVLGGMGLALHCLWCRKNGIDLLEATPIERYYHLRGWPWPPGSARQSSSADDSARAVEN